MEGAKSTEETCFDGVPTALHAAAIKGQSLVLRELAIDHPEFIQVLTNQGETALHLTVKWNRLEALKVLVEEMMKNTNELMNWKDCEGNTVLHIAVSNKHLQIVNYLLRLNGLQVNALNKNDLTALDLLTQSPRDHKAMEIELALRNAGASSVNDLHVITHNWFQGNAGPTRLTPSSQEHSAEKCFIAAAGKSIIWLCKERSTLLTVLSLIITVAFQAGLSSSKVLPDKCILDDSGESGVWHDNNGADAVLSVLQIIFTMVSLAIFLSAVAAITSEMPLRKKWWLGLQLVVMWIAVGFQVRRYLVTVRHITGQCQSYFSPHI